MSKSSPFVLQFSGLKLGAHNFEFVLEETFFDSCSSFGVTSGNGNAIAVLEKKETMMLLSFNLSASINVLCDRCNDSLTLAVQGSMELIYKFGTEESLDESLVILPHDSYQIDLFHPLYELFVVSLPSRFIHENDGCDPEILKYLSPSKEEPETKNEIDPRWSALSKLN